MLLWTIWKEFGFTTYIETASQMGNKKFTEAFFLFLDKMKIQKLFSFLLYDGEITDIIDLSVEDIKKNLMLEHENKGMFYNNDPSVSKMFSDCITFYLIPEVNVIFFAGKDDAIQVMKDVLIISGIKFFEKPIKGG